MPTKEMMDYRISEVEKTMMLLDDTMSSIQLNQNFITKNLYEILQKMRDLEKEIESRTIKKHVLNHLKDLIPLIFVLLVIVGGIDQKKLVTAGEKIFNYYTVDKA